MTIDTTVMPPVFTCIPLPTLPQVPQHFVDHVLNVGHNNLLDEDNIMPAGKSSLYRDRDVILNGVAQKSKVTARYALGDEWELWVKQNIIDNYYDTSARITVRNQYSVTGPHVDYPGKIRLFYLVDSGGPDVETVWYMRPGEPVLFDTETWGSEHGYPYCDNNIDKLLVIDRKQIPLNTWVAFNGYIRHAVLNQTGCRIFFDISMRPENFNFTIEKVNK
jgi:hypothetical protein